jgi:Alginate lyase
MFRTALLGAALVLTVSAVSACSDSSAPPPAPPPAPAPAPAGTPQVPGQLLDLSSYPRSELREMNGQELASWSNTTGTHTLRLREAVTLLPAVKPHVVAAQIHDADDDVIEVRVEGQRLLVQYNDGDDDATLDPAYALGTPYDLEIAAADGHIRVSYNGTQKADIVTSGSGWYFKAGSYVQSNLSRGDAPDAQGQVVLYALQVEHTP